VCVCACVYRARAPVWVDYECCGKLCALTCKFATYAAFAQYDV
jgi:hypothetical protein